MYPAHDSGAAGFGASGMPGALQLVLYRGLERMSHHLKEVPWLVREVETVTGEYVEGTGGGGRGRKNIFLNFEDVIPKGEGIEIVKSYRQTVPLNMRKNFLLGKFPKLSGHITWEGSTFPNSKGKMHR